MQAGAEWRAGVDPHSRSSVCHAVGGRVAGRARYADRARLSTRPPARTQNVQLLGYGLARTARTARTAVSAGRGAHFVKRIVDDKTGGAKFKIHATVKISTNGQTFGDILLLDSVKQECVQATTSKKEKERSATVGKKRKESASTSGASSSAAAAATGTSSASKAKKPRTQKDNGEDDAGNHSWATDHHSIGTQVANYFSLPGGRKLFRGEVVKYAPPSRPRARDQLYHIRWEDGDEENYDESQLQSAVGLFARHFAAASSVVVVLVADVAPVGDSSASNAADAGGGSGGAQRGGRARGRGRGGVVDDASVGGHAGSGGVQGEARVGDLPRACDSPQHN